jgi:hypothetical protein
MGLCISWAYATNEQLLHVGTTRANCANVHVGKGCDMTFNASKKSDRRRQLVSQQIVWMRRGRQRRHPAVMQDSTYGHDIASDRVRAAGCH